MSPAAPGYLTRPLTQANELVTPDDGWEAPPLLRMMLTQAIVNAAKVRQRAALLLIGFQPNWSCIDGARDWDQTINALARYIPNRRGDRGALRAGAEEIAVISGELGNSLDALVHANEILAVLSQPDCVDGCGIAYRVAIGIGLFPEDGASASVLLDRASEALADMRTMGLSAASFNMRRSLRGSATRMVPRLDANGAATPPRPRERGRVD